MVDEVKAATATVEAKEVKLVAVKVTATVDGYECAGMRFYQKPLQFYATPDTVKAIRADSNLTIEAVV